MRENKTQTNKKSELDRLFHEVGTYRTGHDFQELLQFAKRFPQIAPYNAMLLHMQKPGSHFVASADKWEKTYGRKVKTGARPLVILRPFGPVEFVFELGDTEGDEFVPEAAIDPFKTKGRLPGKAFSNLISKMKCDGISYAEKDYGTESAGFIETAKSGREVCIRGKKKITWVRLLYEMVVNKNHTRVTKMATIAHELGHLYCGHLGTPELAGTQKNKWWKDRRSLPIECQEFEAESVCWLVCERLGIENPSSRYLNGYLDANGEIPPISLEEVLKAAGMMESLLYGALIPKKEIVIRTSVIEPVERQEDLFS